MCTIYAFLCCHYKSITNPFYSLFVLFIISLRGIPKAGKIYFVRFRELNGLYKARFRDHFLPAPMIGIGPYTLVVVAGSAWTQDYAHPATTTSVYDPIPIIGAGKNDLGNSAAVTIRVSAVANFIFCSCTTLKYILRYMYVCVCY